MRTVAISGGFDPLHVGHLNLIRVAKALGDRVVAIVDSDEYVSSKHKLLMPLAERIRILESLADVDSALPNWTANGDCSVLLNGLKPALFVVGPDKDILKLPEYEECQVLGIPILKAGALKKEHSSRNYAKPQYDNPPVCCSAIISNPIGEVLVGRRADNGKWDLPGGFLEPGETLEQCICREVLEEFNIDFVDYTFTKSKLAKYSDGREVVLVLFTGKCEGQVEADGEMSGHGWTRIPLEGMNNQTDELFLSQHFLKMGI